MFAWRSLDPKVTAALLCMLADRLSRPTQKQGSGRAPPLTTLEPPPTGSTRKVRAVADRIAAR